MTYLRWHVSVLTAKGNPHPDWLWIERKGPWILSTTQDQPDEGYGAWQDLHLHKSGPGVDEPEATFESVRIRIGPRAVKAEGMDRPLEKWRRDSVFVVLEMTPDFEPAKQDMARDLLGG